MFLEIKKNIFFIVLSLIYTVDSVADFVYKNFNTSVSDTIGLHGHEIVSDFPLAVINYYEDNIHTVLDQDERYKIPKIMHFIWIGGKFPEYLNFCLKSWKFHHPDWKIKVWGDSNIGEIISKSNIKYSKIVNLGSKVDILRLEIIKKYGGVYVDTDFFCLKPLDDLTKLDFFISSECNYYSLVNNGIIGATPNNPIINQMIHAIKTNLSEQERKGYFDVLTATGPWWVTKFFSNAKSCVVIPPSYFCSFPIYEKEAFWRCDLTLYDLLKKYTFGESIAVHLWHSSWNSSCPMGKDYKDKNYFNELELALRLGKVSPLQYKDLEFTKPYLLIA